MVNPDPDMPNSDLEQAAGAKKKNGHKCTCDCHICENIKNKAKRGGYKEEKEKKMLQLKGGSKKKNGHKPNCMCPICKNMMNKSRKNKKGGDKEYEIINNNSSNNEIIKKKIIKRQEDDDLNNDIKDDYKLDKEYNPEIEKDDELKEDEPKINGEKSGGKRNTKKRRKNMKNKSKKGQEEDTSVGGSKRKSNGHKADCMCPICKNMRKSKK
jgi:hypothetical protein